MYSSSWIAHHPPVSCFPLEVAHFGAEGAEFRLADLSPDPPVVFVVAVSVFWTFFWPTFVLVAGVVVAAAAAAAAAAASVLAAAAAAAAAVFVASVFVVEVAAAHHKMGHQLP